MPLSTDERDRIGGLLVAAFAVGPKVLKVFRPGHYVLQEGVYDRVSVGDAQPGDVVQSNGPPMGLGTSWRVLDESFDRDNLQRVSGIWRYAGKEQT